MALTTAKRLHALMLILASIHMIIYRTYRMSKPRVERMSRCFETVRTFINWEILARYHIKKLVPLNIIRFFFFFPIHLGIYTWSASSFAIMALSSSSHLNFKFASSWWI